MSRPRQQRRAGYLDEEQLHELCSPLGLFLTDARSAFESDEERRQAWETHKDHVMAHYRRIYPNGHAAHCEGKPAAWWAYDAPIGERRSYPEPATPRERRQ